MSDLLKGRCAKPQDPRPMVTTSFCVYRSGHNGNCSWADVPAIRLERLRSGDGLSDEIGIRVKDDAA